MAEATPRPPRIFLSYRRKDHEEVCAVLHARLGTRFGEANVFRDAPNLLPGEEFVRGIPNRVKDCDVLLVLIGPQWVRLIREQAIEEMDYVRMEIVTALEHKKVIIPVLIAGAERPAQKRIHWQVREILERQTATLSDFNNEVEIKALFDLVEKSYRSYSGREGLRQEVERLEEFPPAAGLALGYFENFIRQVVMRIIELSPEQGGYRNIIDIQERGANSATHTFATELGSRANLKLHVVLPPTLDCLLPARLNPVMAKLYQASIHAPNSARPFLVDAWQNENEFQLLDFPRTLGVLNTWLQRRLSKPPRDPESEEWRQLAEEEIRRFEIILKWWVEDPRNGPDFTATVRIVRFTGQEPELAWLKEFWPEQDGTSG
jgi:hypothetical protein